MCTRGYTVTAYYFEFSQRDYVYLRINEASQGLKLAYSNQKTTAIENTSRRILCNRKYYAKTSKSTNLVELSGYEHEIDIYILSILSF
jgi:hypothetical protein